MTSQAATADGALIDPTKLRRAILGASVGSLFEWYDFFAYAFLAVYFSNLFFPAGNETSGFLSALAIFAAGFIIRPLGAVIFGHIGDRIGRKRTFLITLVIMGLATTGIGLIPTFEQIGWAAPILLVIARLLQGLSIGGEYAGAVVYVAEHSSNHDRGYRTSWIQMTATGGMLLAIVVIVVLQLSMDRASFAAWGWRIPFVLSLGLLLVSIYIRLRLDESPLFEKLKASRARSSLPIADIVKDLSILKFTLQAFLICGAQAIIGYTTQVYPLFFMINTLKITPMIANTMLGIALIWGMITMIILGKLSDHVGRKWVMLSGMLLFSIALIPIFKGLTSFGNPALVQFQERVQVSVLSNDCRFKVFVTPNTNPTLCDRAQDFLNKAGISYLSKPADGSGEIAVKIGDTVVRGFDPAKLTAALIDAGYPSKGDPANVNVVVITLLLMALTLLSSMIYAPLGAYLAEQFPTRVRYSAVAVAQNFGAGWIGGSLLFVVAALTAYAGNIYFGLWYPVIAIALILIVAALFLKETKHLTLED